MNLDPVAKLKSEDEGAEGKEREGEKDGEGEEKEEGLMMRRNTQGHHKLKKAKKNSFLEHAEDVWSFGTLISDF